MKYLNEAGLRHLISKMQKDLEALRKKISESQTEKEPDPSTWEGVQAIVRAGRAADYFSVGDQFVCNHKDFGEITWDIIGIDQDTPADPALSHSLTLQTHDLLTSVPFDTNDAAYYAETGLSPGDYWLQIPQELGASNDGGKSIAFTLTSPVPAGGLVIIGKFTNGSYKKLFHTYASGESINEIESGSIQYANTGTELSPINNNMAIRFGENRWAHSPIRKYLNSTAEKGAVWYPSSTFDRIPDWMNNYDGFLKGLDQDLASVLGPVKIKEYDSTTETMTETEDTVFLPSKGQVYAGPVLEGQKEDPYAYYALNSSLGNPNQDGDNVRIKYYQGTAYYWWLRSPEAHNTYAEYQVDNDGYVIGTSVWEKHYIAPVCCIV